MSTPRNFSAVGPSPRSSRRGTLCFCSGQAGLENRASPSVFWTPGVWRPRTCCAWTAPRSARSWCLARATESSRPRRSKPPGLILDGVDCLYGREGAVSLLGGLLRDRCARGLKTVVTQGPADDSIGLLYSAVPPQVRASVLLRFPVGRGRRRFVQQECRRLSIPFSLAREHVMAEPWTYASVRAAIEALAVGPAVAPDSGAVHGPSAEMPG